MHRQAEIVSAGLVGSILSRGTAAGDGLMTEERLPFTVKVARSEQELGKAVHVRHAAYARHLPALAERLKRPESYDHDEGSVVLLAESKMDGSPLGTMRIQTNLYRKLAIQQAVELPEWLNGRSLAEATRLGVSDGRIGRLVKTVLFKAFFEYCLDAQIEWMVIAARSPLDRQYEALLFRDVFPGGGFVPLSYASNLPHRVLAFEVETAEDRWAEARHPLFDFMRRTRHPDIDVREAEATFNGVNQPMERYAGARA
ncbi:MAG: hypothetical protein HY017_34070 [Betaproteobacteria bacterium]|nr:hypothetical protein [Betaproteobacteria bacterium]